MIAIAYVIPVLACLILHFGFRYEGSWSAYAWLFGCGEATVGLLYFLCYRRFTSYEEFLGSIIVSIHYEAPWTQIVVRYETRTDSKGRTYTVTRRDYIYHPEIYYFLTSIGSRLSTEGLFFNYVKDLWPVPRHNDTWTGPQIRGGIRFGFHYNLHDLGPEAICDTRYWIPITESHRYKNKIRSSNSIFKFEKIDNKEAEQLGLFKYPHIFGYDAPCILTDGTLLVTPYADDKFRKFNAGLASKNQMRLYILLFNHTKGIKTSELQKAYWQGGNKNEMVVCIGVDSDAKIYWARAFSWADEQQLEVELAQWLMKGGHLNWDTLYTWLESHVSSWKRKEFKDFDYIQVTLPLKHILPIIILSLIENAVVLWIILQNL